MKTVQQLLVCTLLAALTALAAYAILLLHAARVTVAAIPKEIQSTRSAVLGEIAAARCDLTRQIAVARRDLLATANRQATALRTESLAEIAEMRKTADRRLGDTLARVDTAIGKIDDVRGDLQPVLAHTAALVRDAQDSWDDLYWDVKASIASATVAANSVGQMSLDVQNAVPGTLRTWNAIGGNVASITGNIDRLTKPRWYDRLLGYGLNGIVMYRNLNPATNVTLKGAQVLSNRP